MRVLLAILFLAAGVTAAGAGGSRRHLTHDYTLAARALPLVIYDYRPGVVVRAYWLAPWRHRHYYPTTGDKPEVGREEDLSPGGNSSPEPAESFQRSWSTSSAFLPEAPRSSRSPDAEPSDEPPRIPAPLK
jgi:hypothetical protein